MLGGCGPDLATQDARLAACEPDRAGVRRVWEQDLRAPCGEDWLLEHAPNGSADDPSPLRAARETVRDLVRGEPVEPARSLSLRPEGLPSDVWAAHLQRLTEVAPDGFADPWLAARLGLEREDPAAASALVAWSAWDPDDLRRQQVLARAAELFDQDVPCVDVPDAPAPPGERHRCAWRLADAIAGELGVVGRRDRPSDPVWAVHGARAAGMAGDWVAAWEAWIARDPARAGVVRPGAAREPAGALWSGGNDAAVAALRVELGLSDDRAAVHALIPAAAGVDGPGSRAAALVPWDAISDAGTGTPR